MRILITGFEAWAGKKNPSGMIAKNLDGKAIKGLDVIGRVLPEDFYALPGLSKKLIAEIRPDAVISTGWDYTKAIKVEKIALNVMNSFFVDSVVPDNYGNKPSHEPIIRNAPIALQSTLPADEIVQELRKNNIPAVVSYYAGTHCCNTVMYSFLHTDKVKISGFIHVPPLPEMVKGVRTDSIVMSIDEQEKAIQLAIEVCARHLLPSEKDGHQG
ncbi:MAG: pyroglutamyl-peptidase I [Nitrososphaerota archaeon]